MPITKTARRAQKVSKKKEAINKVNMAKLQIAIRQAKKSKSETKVKEAISLVDKNKKPIAVGKTELDNVRFHEGRSFVVLFPKESPSPADIYAEAIVNVFNAANIR